MCNEVLASKEMVVVVSSPTTILQSTGSHISYDYGDAVANEQVVHLSCMQTWCESLYNLVCGLETTNSSIAKTMGRSIQTESDTKEIYFKAHSLCEAVNATGETVSMDETGKFVFANPDLSLEDLVKEWFVLKD